ncbi:MAG TPA: efflux RND transporter periplasmic adaptor subunit [Verrucomicrobiota bacterium]|nr:efflux RND transporter periplasmic adaptor subunit [Verrucomicrobiota bacterium]
MKRLLRIAIPLAAAAFLLGACNPRSTSITVSGTIESDEARVASRYGGRVQAIHAREGDALSPGQLIIELDAAELRARRDEIAALLAELEAGPRKEEIEAAKAEWEAQTAEWELAVANARRAEELFAQNTISTADRDQAVTRANALQKAVAAARSRYDLLLAGTRPEQIARVRAQLDQIDAQLKEMKIVAPTNCVLETLSVKVGDVVAPNQPAATLLLPHLWVRVFVPAPWLGHIKVGDVVPVRVDSFPDREFEGTVEQVAREAEFTPRNVQTVEERIKQVFGIKVQLDHNSDALRAGMSADVAFPNVPR